MKKVRLLPSDKGRWLPALFRREDGGVENPRH